MSSRFRQQYLCLTGETETELRPWASEPWGGSRVRPFADPLWGAGELRGSSSGLGVAPCSGCFARHAHGFPEPHGFFIKCSSIWGFIPYFYWIRDADKAQGEISPFGWEDPRKAQGQGEMGPPKQGQAMRCLWEHQSRGDAHPDGDETRRGEGATSEDILVPPRCWQTPGLAAVVVELPSPTWPCRADFA